MPPELLFNPYLWFLWMLISTIWLALIGTWCQFLRYPDFKKWNPGDFQKRHRRHAFWMAILVLPAFLVQTIGAFLAVKVTFPPLSFLNPILCVAGLVLTFFFASPLHSKIARSQNTSEIDRLLQINAIRTVVWIAHAVFGCWWHPMVR
jgi:uncharacterized membrane protein YhaH (DUF805 family)